MNNTGLEIDRGVILDRSGKPFYSGNLNFDQLWTICFDVWAKTRFQKTNCFRGCFQTIPIRQNAQKEVGSFHGVGKKSIL